MDASSRMIEQNLGETPASSARTKTLLDEMWEAFKKEFPHE
jgi:hypothetical protein